MPHKQTNRARKTMCMFEICNLCMGVCVYVHVQVYVYMDKYMCLCVHVMVLRK